MVPAMAKRVSGAGVNRSAARRAAEVAALRAARRQAHEQAVTAAVAVYFDRSASAVQVRVDAHDRAERILADAERSAGDLDGGADQALATLKALGEPVVEIAAMVKLPVAGVRAAVTRAATRSSENSGVDVMADGSGAAVPPVVSSVCGPLGGAQGIRADARQT